MAKTTRTSPLVTLSVRPATAAQVRDLQREHGWSNARVAELAIDAFAHLKPDQRTAVNKRVPLPVRRNARQST